MFGHQDSDNNSNSNNDAVASATTAPEVNEQIQQLSAPPNDNTPTIASDPVVDDLSVENAAANEAVKNRQVLSPAGGYPQAPSQKIRPSGAGDEQPEPPVMPEPQPQPDNPAPDSDLNTIKQEVISELFPLIDELDQPPDERFKTLMMMIQATDNQTLIKSAYDAAHNISDPRKKAQALLDIINEINYFSQHS